MNKRIKVLLVVEAMLGGIRQHVIDIAYGLNAEKYDIYMAYSDHRADEKFFEEYENLQKHIKLIRCEYMQRELGLNDLKAIGELKQIISKLKPDIVHCHSSKAGIVGRMAAKRCGVGYIYYTPNAYSFQNPCLGRLKKFIYITAERFLSKFYTTKTISVSHGEMDCALKYRIDRKEKFVLIYNGIEDTPLPDREKIRKENGFEDEQILIGVTARLAEQKDPMTFLEIAEKVIKEDKRVHFIYIGDGEMRHEVQDWIIVHQLADRIHMMGFRKDASVLVAMLDIYLSTALYEGLPYSMIEAMRAGVPIIATDVVGNNELVTDGVNGLLFPVKDVEVATRLILKQIRNDTISDGSVRESFVKKFSDRVMIRKIEDLFQINDTVVSITKGIKA